MTNTLNNNLDEIQSLSHTKNILYDSYNDSIVGIAIFKGRTHIFEYVNTAYKKMAYREITIGKPARELFPEIEQQGYWQILDNVFETGEPFIFNELPVDLISKISGKLENGIFGSVRFSDKGLLK